MSTPRIRLNSECITAAKMAVEHGLKGRLPRRPFLFLAQTKRAYPLSAL